MFYKLQQERFVSCWAFRPVMFVMSIESVNNLLFLRCIIIVGSSDLFLQSSVHVYHFLNIWGVMRSCLSAMKGL